MQGAGETGAFEASESGGTAKKYGVLLGCPDEIAKQTCYSDGISILSIMEVNHMRAFHTVLISGLLLAGTFGAAMADIKGPKGEKCESTETKISHKIKDKPYICDKCVYSQCDTSGGKIDKCARVTYYDNCTEAPAAKKDEPKKD